MLIDSNIIIYAMRPEHSFLRQFIAEKSPAVSALSCIEVLGYHKLLDRERVLLEAFFAAAPLLPITELVVAQAVKLRQQRKISLGDVIIAATAMVHNLTLVSRNASDFEWISGLRLWDPFSAPH